MSGVLGLVRDAQGPPPVGDLEAMRDAMAFWGGDGERHWARRGVGLAHLLQSVTTSRDGGPSAAALPEADGVVVCADVRLDNRAELAEQLGSRARADEELLLEAYRRWGERCVERLRGAFAFAVWDGPRNRLVCARDHAGFRPFAYWEGPGGFVFASDAGAILACEGVPAVPDQEAMVARVARDTELLRERSFFEGVRKLPAGELLVFELGRGSHRARHWFPERCRPRAHRTPEDCASALRETLTAAVADAVDSDASVGAHLSGGLDSSAATVLAQLALRRRGRALARTFCWAPPVAEGGVEATEHERVEAVARALEVAVSYVTLDEEDLLAEAGRDEALEPNELLVYENPVMAEAARHGISVLVSGWGGDEAASFNGRGQLAWLAARGHWRRLWREASSPGRHHGAVAVVRAAERNIRKRALVPFLPDWAYQALGLGEIPAHRELARRGHGWGDLYPLVDQQRRDMRRRRRLRPSAHAMQLSVLRQGHLENRLESWARAGARLGIDHRYPLLDRRVLELCLAMPGDVWIRDGTTRWLFRQAVAPLLPSDVDWSRPKDEPARMGSWLALLADARLDDDSDASALSRAHRRHRQELARMRLDR